MELWCGSARKKPWNHRTIVPQNHRTINHRTIKPQNDRIKNHRTTEPWNHRTIEPQNHRIIEWYVLEGTLIPFSDTPQASQVTMSRTLFSVREDMDSVSFGSGGKVLQESYLG
uniref:Uncharacterized protein n=1 Tax=Phasianus colchicus TaxID=9054 RepID=A0A669PFZ4_PHACC